MGEVVGEGRWVGEERDGGGGVSKKGFLLHSFTYPSLLSSSSGARDVQA